MGRKSRELAKAYARVKQLQNFVQAIEEAGSGVSGAKFSAGHVLAER
jgi:hypothetical protein